METWKPSFSQTIGNGRERFFPPRLSAFPIDWSLDDNFPLVNFQVHRTWASTSTDWPEDTSPRRARSSTISTSSTTFYCSSLRSFWRYERWIFFRNMKNLKCRNCCENQQQLLFGEITRPIFPHTISPLPSFPLLSSIKSSSHHHIVIANINL